MPWKNRALCFVVAAATLASLKARCGQAVGAGAFVQRTPSEGRLHFRSLASDGKREFQATARSGSIAFGSGEAGGQKSTHVDAKLKRLDPSVQCSDNVMTLRVKGIRTPQFLVNSGVGPLTPLSQMHPSCGFSVKRSRRDVLFAAPYQGCHVTQKGWFIVLDGDYILPLRLWGAPMTVSCPAVLPPSSVSCFPSGMVVKIGVLSANELKVKVSGTWESLSSVCGSCGIAVEVSSGGLTLTAPYSRGLCIDIKDKEYSLTLQLVDVELLVTCPSLTDIQPTTATTMPPNDGGQVLQYPQFPYFPVFPQYPVLPEPYPTPAKSTMAPLPQQPQLPSGSAADPISNNENQEAPVIQYPSLPFMPWYPQFSPYIFYPRPVPPKQSATNKDTPAPQAQLPQMPHSQHDEKPIPQQPEYPVPPQYHFLPVPKLPLPPGGQPQAVPNPKPVIQQPKPQHVYSQTYPIPVLYPPQRQNTQSPTAAPATNALKPAAQKPFYYPRPYMPVYYPPQPAPMPVLPNPSSLPLTNAAPFDLHGHQSAYRAMPQFYPFPSHQVPKQAVRNQ